MLEIPSGEALAKLRVELCRLDALLKDPNPGLLTWLESYLNTIDEIAVWGSDAARMNFIETGHWDLIYRKALKGLWGAGNCDTGDELGDGYTAREAIDRAMQIKAGMSRG